VIIQTPTAHSTGLPFIDTTQDAEQHLVGRQTAAITIDRVYKNSVLQTAGGGNDYQISTQVIDGQTHTEIHWEAGNRPLVTDFISCDITFGSRGPVEAIKHFMENFCGYENANFNAASYAAAAAKESDRGYDFSGALWEAKPLQTILDDWRNQWELDIFWNKDGEVMFSYITSDVGAATHYDDYLHILGGFSSDPQVNRLLNYLRYGYNYHYSKTYYYDYNVYQDTDSQTKYGGTFKSFSGLRWTRSSAVAHDKTQ